MRRKDWAVIAAIITLFAIQVAFIISNAGEFERNEIRREAVRLGHAEYVPDEHGNTTFRWMEVTGEAH